MKTKRTQIRQSAKRHGETDFFKNLCAFAPLRLCVLLLFVVASAGCVSKTKAKLEIQQAYIAGQQNAMATMQQTATTVQIRGNVKNTSIPWTEGLTLAKAIVAAEYQGAHDPASVIIVRKGMAIEINAAELLQGHDEPLQAGDVVQIQ
jgi:hypothetical protein